MVAARGGLLLLAVALSLAGQPLPRGDEEDVLEAVLRYEVQQQRELRSDPRLVYCLALDPGGAPQSASKQFMQRFRAQAGLRRAAECEQRSKGAVELATSGPALLLTAGPIEWVAADEAWVTLAHFRTRSDRGVRVFRVVREPSRWICLGPVIRQ